MAYLKQVEYAMQAMMANSYLITCAQKNPNALINSLKSVALSGLSLSKITSQGYLVPFNGEIQFMPSYIGLRDLMVRTGLVHNIEANLVYVDDYFSVSFGADGKLEHRPAVFSKNRKKEHILGGYFYAKLCSGVDCFGTMSIEELELIHKRSPSFGKASPWSSDYEEMLKKSLIRRGWKSVPHTGVSSENLRIIEMAFNANDKLFYDPEDKNNQQSKVGSNSILLNDSAPMSQPVQEAVVVEEPANSEQ